MAEEQQQQADGREDFHGNRFPGTKEIGKGWELS
jgi:hypothetical protein